MIFLAALGDIISRWGFSFLSSYCFVAGGLLSCQDFLIIRGIIFNCLRRVMKLKIALTIDGTGSMDVKTTYKF